MRYNIHSDKLKITKNVKDYIIEKLNKLNKYFIESDNLTARIVIKIKNVNQKIEVTIPTKSFVLRGEETNERLLAAVDLVVDKLERQIRKNKTKLQNKKANNKIIDDFNFVDGLDDEYSKKKIVRRKKLEMKPMSEEEAILQLEMLDHDFFIFRHATIDRVCVLYKRKSGQYGMIEIS